jgi:hypothetical protein
MNRTDFKQLMREQFGELNATQLWALVKFAKNVRLRCRNNSAFNNFMNQTFGDYASFRTVTKTRKNWKTGLDETYPGLQITVKGETKEEEEGDE